LFISSAKWAVVPKTPDLQITEWFRRLKAFGIIEQIEQLFKSVASLKSADIFIWAGCES